MTSKTTELEDLIASSKPTTDFEVPWAPLGAKRFNLVRQNDETGVSGRGIIAQGCLFADGTAAMQWRCPPAASDVVVKKWETILDIHVRQHPKNRTLIVWEDGKHELYEPKPQDE